MLQYYERGLKLMENFLTHPHFGLTAKEAARHRADIATFYGHLQKGAGDGSFFSTKLALLYRDGKIAFDRVIDEIRHPVIPVDRLHRIIADVTPGLTVCPEGILSNLVQAGRNIRWSGRGLQDSIKRFRTDFIDARLQEFAAAMHGHEPNFAGNEIHYVNGYRNRLADRFGLQTHLDDAVPPQIDDEGNVERCAAKIAVACSPENVVMRMAQDFRDDVDRHFGQKPFLTAYEIGNIAELEAELAPRYGNVSPHSYLAEAENASGETIYDVRSDTSLIERDIVKNLQAAKVLRQKRSLLLAGGKQERFAVKSLGWILYVNHYERNRLIERRPFLPTDFDSPALEKCESEELLARAVDVQSERGVDHCLAAGANVDTRDRFGLTPLIRASAQPFMKSLRAFTERGADLEIAHPDSGDTALMFAIDSEQIAKVEELLNAGANPNVRNYAGHTPLMFATERKNRTVAAALLDRGAFIDAKDVDGLTPLMYAARSGYFEMLEMLLARGASANETNAKHAAVLHFAASLCPPDATTALIDAGARVNAIDVNGNTPLHCAVDKGREDIAKLLIAHGANVDIANTSDETAAALAAARGHTEIMKTLIAANADLDYPASSQGRRARAKTPQHIAARHHNDDIVKLILAEKRRRALRRLLLLPPAPQA